MAYNGFLKIASMKGDSQADGHVKEIEVMSWRQRFAYGKQSILRDVDRFTKLNLNQSGDEFKALKSLQDDIPDFSGLESFTARNEQGSLTGQRDTIKYGVMQKHLNKWEKNLSSTLGSLDDAWKTKNENMMRVFNHFQSALQDFQKNFQTSSHEPLFFSKYVDSASPKLFEACASGEKIPECTFYLYRSANLAASGTVSLAKSGESDFVEVTLYNVAVVRYEIKGDANLPKEDLRFDYDKAKFNFVEGDPSTGKKGANKVITWDWTQGTATAS